MLEGAGFDGSPAVFVKDSEGHPDHVFVVDSPHLGRHHVAELRKLNLTGPVCVVLKEFVFNCFAYFLLYYYIILKVPPVWETFPCFLLYREIK